MFVAKTKNFKSDLENVLKAKDMKQKLPQGQVENFSSMNRHDQW